MYKLGNDRLALPFLQRATELDENDVEAVFQCGLCFARLEHVQEAKPYFEKVLEMDESMQMRITI